MLRDAIRAAARHRGPSIWRKLLGWTCVIVGLPGLILPIIPGIPLLVLGIVLLAGQHRWAHNILEWAKRRLPWTRLHLHDDPPQIPVRVDRDKSLGAEEQP